MNPLVPAVTEVSAADRARTARLLERLAEAALALRQEPAPGAARPSRAELAQLLGDAQRALLDDQATLDQELHAAYDRAALIARATDDALWDWDVANRKLWWGGGYRELFGDQAPDLNPSLETWNQHVHPDDRERVLAEIKTAMAGPAAYGQMEYRFLREDGSCVHVLDRYCIVRDAGGRAIRLVGVMMDITERKQVLNELTRAKEDAEAAARAKSQFLAVMSHEIRTPLNPILGAAQLLLDQGGTPEQQDLLQLISQAGEHLLLLLNDILNLAKLESGRVQMNSEPVRVRELVGGVLEIKRQDAARKGLLLEQYYDQEIAYSYLADEARLRQILLNLVGNAVKFTERGGISVRVERLDTNAKGDHLCFEVRDTGIGIPADQIAQLFQPFFQVDSSSSRRYEGAGLGLAICRRLVELMHGEVGVESLPGQGSRFWFQVWLERSLLRPGRNTPPPMSRQPFTLRRVLLVEDDARNRAVLIPMLERLGCKVTAVGDAQGALALFQPGAFDLALVDLGLPDLDGCELTRRLRQLEASLGAPRLPIIAQSASTSVGETAAVRDSGMDDFIAKPLHLSELSAKLNHHVPPVPVVPPPRRSSTPPLTAPRPGFMSREPFPH